MTFLLDSSNQITFKGTGYQDLKFDDDYQFPIKVIYADGSGLKSYNSNICFSNTFDGKGSTTMLGIKQPQYSQFTSMAKSFKDSGSKSQIVSIQLLEDNKEELGNINFKASEFFDDAGNSLI